MTGLVLNFYTDLATQVEDELEACIGCHLCLRACPLPDAKVIQMGDLNDALTGGPMSERILRFTLDCTQCGACVPVCPANLSRMRMMLAAKLRVEVPPADAPVYVHVNGQPMASGWTAGTLANQLANYPIFAGVDLEQLQALIPRVGLRYHEPGSIIVRENEYSNSLYLIVTGSVEESVLVPGGARMPLLRLEPGYFFGELGILSDRPNPTTVTATSPTYLLDVSDATLRRLMAEAEAFRERLEALHARRKLGANLRRIALFQQLPDEAMAWIIERASVRVLERGAVLAEEGEPAETFALILSGFLKVSRRGPDGTGRVVTYRRDGSYFADWSLMSGQPRAATLAANTRCEVMELPRDDFGALLSRYPQLSDAFIAQSREDHALLERVGQPQAPPGTHHLAVLLDQGVLQSHGLLLIDERLCIDCNNCVDACVRRHGHPRLARKGLTVGPYLVATACRHCDDPLCLLCPVDGIVRAPDGQIEITTNCIGCGACASRCPYDNIQMADKQRMSEVEARPGGIWGLLQNLGTPRGSGALLFDRDDLRPKVAVKCDLCTGYRDGPACVRNCPTGAAFRADGASFFGSGEAIAATATAARPRRR